MIATQKLSLRNKGLFIPVIQLILILMFEVGARSVFFVKEGFNPYYLSYGFVRDIEWCSGRVRRRVCSIESKTGYTSIPLRGEPCIHWSKRCITK